MRSVEFIVRGPFPLLRAACILDLLAFITPTDARKTGLIQSFLPAVVHAVLRLVILRMTLSIVAFWLVV